MVKNKKLIKNYKKKLLRDQLKTKGFELIKQSFYDYISLVPIPQSTLV